MVGDPLQIANLFCQRELMPCMCLLSPYDCGAKCILRLVNGVLLSLGARVVCVGCAVMWATAGPFAAGNASGSRALMRACLCNSK